MIVSKFVNFTNLTRHWGGQHSVTPNFALIGGDD